MKKVKSFRLEEDVIKIIESQPNATQFIEDLVRGKKDTTPAEDYIIQTLDDIKQLLEKPRGGGVNKVPSIVDKVSIPNLKNRPIREILGEIRELEAHRDERLEYCQDPEEADKLISAYKDQIDNLWAEYEDVKQDL